MAVGEVHVPKTLKPCVIALAQEKGGKLAAMAVTWIMQSGHEPPRIEISIDQRHKTHEAAVNLGSLVLAYATPGLCPAFDMLGSTTGNDPGVDKLQLLRQKGVRVEYTDEGMPWLPDARVNLLCDVKPTVTTEDGYTIFSCEPTVNLGGSGDDQLYYAGRVEGARSYLTAGIPTIVP